MVQSINLIPQEEVKEQSKEKAVRVSTILSILILVVVCAVSAYFLFVKMALNAQINSVNAELGTLRSQINSQASLEVLVRNLDKRYSTLNSILKDRVYYSALLEELAARSPAGIEVTNFDFHDKVLNLSGTASNYQIFADFMTNLLDKNYPTGNPALKGLFTNVQLSGLSLLGSSNSVSYSIQVTFDDSLLKEQK
jgi:Tfp pilus assembly protein PilN